MTCGLVTSKWLLLTVGLTLSCDSPNDITKTEKCSLGSQSLSGDSSTNPNLSVQNSDNECDPGKELLHGFLDVK